MNRILQAAVRLVAFPIAMILGVTVATAQSNVNVVNTPTVTIAGTPTVNIGATNAPLLIKDFENPVHQPFSYNASLIVFAGNQGTGVMVPIPAGKRLVVEQISAIIRVPAGLGEIPSIQVAADFINPESSGGVANGHLTYIGHLSGNDRYMGIHSTRLYASNNIYIQLFRSEDYNNVLTGLAAGSVSVSGYLVNVP